MATVSEILRGVSQGFVVLAGPAGLGREVRRIGRVRPMHEVLEQPGTGDLVVYTAIDRRRSDRPAPDRALIRLMNSGVAGVITDLEPAPEVLQAAEGSGAPLLASIGGVDTEQIHGALVRSLADRQSLLQVQQSELQTELNDLARSGAQPAMLLDRLVEKTGKAGVLHTVQGEVEHSRQAILQDLAATTFRRAVETTAANVRSWLLQTADPTVNTLLYLELPGERLVRLVGPVWLDGEVRMVVSLIARAAELTGRDRVALLAATRALATALALATPAEPAMAVGRRRCAAVVLRVVDSQLDHLADTARTCFEGQRPLVTVGNEDVRLVLPYEATDHWGWSRRVADWHLSLSKEMGAVTLGHSVRYGPAVTEARQALVQAAEAALIGEQLFGPGHITSFAEAQVARFLLGRETFELQALYEHAMGKLAAEDLKREGELVATLEAYCQTLSTQRTAERLQVHRNTVLYRLRRIQEITCVDLDDSSGRLVLQLGVLAGRLVRGPLNSAQPKRQPVSAS